MSGHAARPHLTPWHRTGRRTDLPAPSRGTAEPSRRLAVVAVALALLGFAVACGDDDDTATEGTSSTTAAPVSSATSVGDDTTVPDVAPSTSPEATPETTVEGIDPMDDAGLDPVRGAALVEGTAHITDVAVARHEGYDRVVLTFEDGLPGYEVGYVDGPLTEDASGEPVAVEGSAYLQVRMEPASTVDLSGDELRQTYTGPTRIDADTPEVTEVVRTGDFEAVAHWVIGVTDPGVAFRVLTLSDPPRLVVDVQNH